MVTVAPVRNPLPVSVMSKGLSSASLLVIWMAALRLPTAVGANVTVKVVLAFGAFEEHAAALGASVRQDHEAQAAIALERLAAPWVGDHALATAFSASRDGDLGHRILHARADDGRPLTYVRALQLLEDGVIDVAPVVSHRYASLEALPSVFAGAYRRPDFVKGVLTL
mgnify:CR=1 FL=1